MRTMDMNEVVQVGGGFSQHVITMVENGETSYVAADWIGALEIALTYNMAGHSTSNM
ncbi:hypothetical protein [uncultured Stenotrophomonas sp.]|uniref:hypothetical protein n=1 Tax=uncultured Stenotrophomonas sp. TaxID=165438 RepID=UPI0025E6AC69|nr:hypothetical protein [uncultured Stenotrophomonas sp.]